MRPELHDYLDGELARHELPEELRGEAARWDRLLAEMREVRPQGAPEHLTWERLRARVRKRRGAALSGAIAWAVRPRPIRVSPLAGLAAAAVIALLILLPYRQDTTPPAGPAAGQTVFVQFVLDAPTAHSVAVAGDFNSWNPQLVLNDADGDGVWTGRVALEPGVHQYMFVIDGSQWLSDPQADRYVDDGFGNRNAVLVIPQAARS